MFVFKDMLLFVLLLHSYSIKNLENIQYIDIICVVQMVAEMFPAPRVLLGREEQLSIWNMQ